MDQGDVIESARSEYVLIMPRYASLAEEVRHVLEKKLAEAEIAPVSINHRAKTVASFVEKITRKNYTDPLSQTTDLAGVRIVCSYEAELAKVIEIINGCFVVVERVDKAQELGVDRMGYNGKALLVSLGPRYSGGRYENIGALLCEIQVRSILQDAWAIIDHQLAYKSEGTTPDRLRRDLNNVASLLEIAQGIFDTVKEKREVYLSEIQQKKENRPAFLAQPLDLDTVVAYARWKFPDLAASENLTQILLGDLNLKKYPTLQQLDAVVDRAQVAVTAYQNENPSWFKTGTDFLTKSLGFVDPEFRAKHGFASKTRAAFDKYQDLVGN